MRTPWQAEKFKNGLIMSYRYPPSDGQSTEYPEIKLHFGYKGAFSPRQESTLSDAITVAKGFLDDINEMKEWFDQHGMPIKISGETHTPFLLRVLKKCGFRIYKLSDNSEKWHFELITENVEPHELYEKVREGIEAVVSVAQSIEGKRVGSFPENA